MSDSVVAGILRRDDRILLCHRHPDREWYPNVWDLPGGHVDPGESPAQALVRELGEELGIDLAQELGPPFETLIDAAAGIEMTVWVIDFDGEVTNRAPEEHDELRWFDAGAIARLDLAHPAYVALLQRALDA